MSRTKKSRTAGNSSEKFSGQRKETSSQAQQARDKKRKSKLKGHKAGARNTVESKQTQNNNIKKAANKKQLGSKKAVQLIIEDKPQQPAEQPKVQLQPKVKVVKSQAQTQAAKKLSPEKELALIENDQRLNDLLEQLDNEENISQADQSWVDQQMDRHQQLMKELGWLDDEGEEDLLQQFDDAGSALDEFKN